MKMCEVSFPDHMTSSHAQSARNEGDNRKTGIESEIESETDFQTPHGRYGITIHQIPSKLEDDRIPFSVARLESITDSSYNTPSIGRTTPELTTPTTFKLLPYHNTSPRPSRLMGNKEGSTKSKGSHVSEELVHTPAVVPPVLSLNTPEGTHRVLTTPPKQNPTESKVPCKTKPFRPRATRILNAPRPDEVSRQIHSQNEVSGGPQFYKVSKPHNAPRQLTTGEKLSQMRVHESVSTHSLAPKVSDRYEVLISPRASNLQLSRASHLTKLRASELTSSAVKLSHNDSNIYAEPVIRKSATLQPTGSTLQHCRANCPRTLPGTHPHKDSTCPSTPTHMGETLSDFSERLYAEPIPRSSTLKQRMEVAPYMNVLSKTSSLSSLLKPSLKVTEGEDGYMSMAVSPIQRRAKPVKQVEKVEDQYEVMRSIRS